MATCHALHGMQYSTDTKQSKCIAGNKHIQVTTGNLALTFCTYICLGPACHHAWVKGICVEITPCLHIASARAFTCLQRQQSVAETDVAQARGKHLPAEIDSL